LLSGGSGKAAANVGSGGDDIGGGGGDYRGEPDPPTVLIDSEAGPPTAKQRRVARIVMAVAFALLAMCVILIGVTLSMSDRTSSDASLSSRRSRPCRHQPRSPDAMR
uniref:Serine/threonine protein kinase n=1 Tax=Macrostomum lignano TaxID=282301 RepID=A0A1I8I0U9_9PLAT